MQGAGGVGGLLYVKHNGTIYVPHTDAIGNILRYTDTAGNVVAEYTYGAFGNTISATGTMAAVFRHRFSTKYFDIETRLYYYGYRFYSPVLMRWLTRDPIEEDGGLDLYGFCGNSSIWLYDILGLKCTPGTFNLIDLRIASTPQWIKANLNSLEKDAQQLLKALGRTEDVFKVASLATSGGLSALLLAAADESVFGKMPDSGDATKFISGLFKKLSQGPMRLDGVLQWEMCKCVGSKTKWERQGDITGEEDVDFISAGGVPSAMASEFKGAYKKLETKLIREMYSRLRR